MLLNFPDHSFAKYFAVVFGILFFITPAIAQLNADFTSDKPGGCSPLTISFSNTTTGASAGASYKWDFGNGNTSTLKDAGATFKEEKTYTVTLTVKDGSQSSTKTHQVIVYKKPVVNFSASLVKGCLPLPVTFTSSATAGDGTIANYFWDFGDGSTEQGAGFGTDTHTYAFVQKPSVSLTVTNSYGCYNTFEEANVVNVLAALKVDFTADNTILCRVTDAVKFTNTSNGPGALTYAWDFGDNKKGTDKDPSHVYGTKGTYPVSLTVKSDQGCTADASKPAFINVANFATDFDAPALFCQNTGVTFSDKSSPQTNSQVWLVDGNAAYYQGSTFYYTPVTGAHTIQLINTYGSCQDTATKKITVNAAPVLDGFVIDLGGVCGAPVTAKFKDTSKTAVKWEWDFNHYYYNIFNPTSTDQNPSYSYTSDGNYDIMLRVTDAKGCTASVDKNINLYKPIANISITKSTGPDYNPSVGCGQLTLSFAVTPADNISSYQWDFGDGGKSTDKTPTHTYTAPGVYNVLLTFKTTQGCTGTAMYNTIQVFKKPDVDFSASSVTICGNTPVTFTITGFAEVYNWDFGDTYTGVTYSYGNAFTHQYFNDSTYTVTLIATNGGGCNDTVVKTNYIKVFPPFPKISTVINTCDGSRGLVAFTQDSKKALSGTWDFGDGSTTPLNINQQTAQHNYTKTGAYKVVLTAVNGQCSVRDSVMAYVLLKQKPVFSAPSASVCSSGPVTVTVAGMETNPAPVNYTYDTYYLLTAMQYSDGSNFTDIQYQNNTWQNSDYWVLNNLDVNKKDMRVISTSTYFGCADTSNYIPLQIKGPSAGFKVVSDKLCFKAPVVFQDTSKQTGTSPIKTWLWTYGDNTTETLTKGGLVNHIYAVPGYYYPTLQVTDADGCSASTDFYGNYVQVNGPKAAFTPSPQAVSPNIPIYFYNNTNYTNSYNTQYNWWLGDGSTSTDYSPSHAYANIGVDTVKLIASDAVTHCTDTAVQLVYIKNINTSFTFTTSYINNNSCPPLLAKFQNTSVNANSVSWDFGDGGSADNLNFPSHTYYKPGVYKVTLYGYGDNNVIDSTVDSVIVKGPYATLHADVLQGRGTQNVTLTAEARNATSYTWDFADGTLKQTTDTFALHQYLTPGLYTPSLIMKDGSGCSSTFDLADTIVIDSLQINFNAQPKLVCDSADVLFNPDVASLSFSQLQKPLLYYWSFGTGNPADTSITNSPTFLYNKLGKYPVTLKVSSIYGCLKQITDTITVARKTNATVTGPAELCAGNAASFTAAAGTPGNFTWQWSFSNGNTANQQQPAPQAFKDSGSYNIQLLLTNTAGCTDTVDHPLIVHGNPIINAAPEQSILCLGNTVQLQAGGGDVYTWLPATGLSSSNVSSPLASPKDTTLYKVEVTNVFGCKSTDSLTVNVISPFKLKVNPEAFECKGSSVQLLAANADRYVWVGTGLSSNTVANPTATVDTTTTYTVTGFDNEGCFSDQATVVVKVTPLPTVDAGTSVSVPVGSTVNLDAAGSSDVVEYNWSPADYLSCSDCAAPISNPRSAITYTVTATNNYGCTAKDTVSISLVCKSTTVTIPSSFTPNGDGLNDLFNIRGKGIRQVRHLVIFSRWGDVVFEKNNFDITSSSSGWDGTNKSSPVAAGAYVFMAEIVCDTGEIFNYKGTVTLIR